MKRQVMDFRVSCVSDILSSLYFFLFSLNVNRVQLYEANQLMHLSGKNHRLTLRSLCGSYRHPLHCSSESFPN